MSDWLAENGVLIVCTIILCLLITILLSSCDIFNSESTVEPTLITVASASSVSGQYSHVEVYASGQCILNEYGAMFIRTNLTEGTVPQRHYIDITVDDMTYYIKNSDEVVLVLS